LSIGIQAEAAQRNKASIACAWAGAPYPSDPIKKVSYMSDVTSKDIQSLRADVNSLRDLAERVRSTAERGWSGARDSAQTVVDEIEEHALIATLLAFLAGILMGLLLGMRR
jgi:hypothetical protein